MQVLIRIGLHEYLVEDVKEYDCSSGHLKGILQKFVYEHLHKEKGGFLKQLLVLVKPHTKIKDEGLRLFLNLLYIQVDQCNFEYVCYATV